MNEQHMIIMLINFYRRRIHKVISSCFLHWTTIWYPWEITLTLKAIIEKYTYKITNLKKEIILQSVNLPVSNPSLSNWFCEMLLFFVTALAVFLLFFRSFWWLLSLLKEILWMKNLSRMVHKGPWCQNAYHLSLLSAEWQSRQ